MVASDGTYKVVGSPRFVRGGVLCPESLALMGSGANRYNGIQRRFGCRYVKGCSILCNVEGWVLEESQVAFVVSPRAGDSHKVGSDFRRISFSCLCLDSPRTCVRTGCGICALILFRPSIGSLRTT